MNTQLCSVCDQSHHSNGYCRKHVRKFKLYGNALEPDKKKGPAKTLFCSIDGCNNNFHAKGCCKKHYFHLLAYGDPKHKRLTPEERYHSYYTRKSENECWYWNIKVDKNGYGKIQANGENFRAHRFGWELFHKKSVPFGMLVCHTCDNPPCQNPKHLFIGTPKDNMTDKCKKGRLVANTNHDSKGRFTTLRAK